MSCLESPNLTWTVHLLREQLSRGAVAIAFVGFAAMAGWWYVGPVAGVAVTLALLISLAEFFCPVRYEINEDAAVSQCLGRKKRVSRQQVTNCYVDDMGLKLSTCGGNRRLEPFRGLYLRFDGNAEQVIGFVEDLWKVTCEKQTP